MCIRDSQYAVAGPVEIDTSAVPGDAAATICKALTVIAAALAPGRPFTARRHRRGRGVGHSGGGARRTGRLPHPLGCP